MDEEIKLPQKRIIIEFIGGDADGEYWDSSSDSMKALMAQGVYVGTGGGAIGRGMRTMPYAMSEEALKGNKAALKPYHPHEYRIAERLETDSEILLRMKYIGQVH
jgi:hypothetical protein